jgi:hypothetical protein
LWCFIGDCYQWQWCSYQLHCECSAANNQWHQVTSIAIYTYINQYIVMHIYLTDFVVWLLLCVLYRVIERRENLVLYNTAKSNQSACYSVDWRILSMPISQYLGHVYYYYDSSSGLCMAMTNSNMHNTSKYLLQCDNKCK